MVILSFVKYGNIHNAINFTFSIPCDAYLHIFYGLLHTFSSGPLRFCQQKHLSSFSFADHVRNICKICFIQVRDLRRVRQYLTDDAAVLAANALGSSHLYYYNSLFRSLSSFHMCKLQCIQNTLDCHKLQ